MVTRLRGEVAAALAAAMPAAAAGVNAAAHVAAVDSGVAFAHRLVGSATAPAAAMEALANSRRFSFFRIRSSLYPLQSPGTHGRLQSLSTRAPGFCTTIPEKSSRKLWTSIRPEAVRAVPQWRMRMPVFVVKSGAKRQ